MRWQNRKMTRLGFGLLAATVLTACAGTPHEPPLTPSELELTVTKNSVLKETNSPVAKLFFNKEHTRDDVYEYRKIYIKTLQTALTAYIDYLTSAELVTLFEEKAETVQIQLNLQDSRVERGTGIAVHVLEAKARLVAAELARNKAQMQFALADRKFRAVFKSRPPELSQFNLPTSDAIAAEFKSDADSKSLKLLPSRKYLVARFNVLRTFAEQNANRVQLLTAVFNSRKRLRASGRETVINVLDSEGDITDGRADWLKAQKSAILAGVKILTESGRLSPATIVNVLGR